MPNEPRFVFDTNVVISALLLKHSVARQAFDKLGLILRKTVHIPRL